MRTVPLALASLIVAAPPLCAQEPPEKKSPPVSAGPEGFSIQNESGDFRLQFRAYTHFDGRFYPGDDAEAATDTFLLRRVRPILQGSLGRYFDFTIMMDFGGGTAVVQDMFVDFKPSPKLRLRAGKFKSPVGLERLQSSPALHFVERALPTALVPNRDVGIQAHGELGGGLLAYQAAVLDGAPDGGSLDSDTNDGKDVAGRLIFSPFKKGGSFLRELGFGIAGVTGKQAGTLPAYRSPGQVVVVTPVTGVTADGTRNRYSPQLLFYSGPFGLLGEHARSESDVKKADGARHRFSASAWQAMVTVSLNWLLTRNVKQMVDFEHASFTGGAAGGDRDSENTVFIRTQIAF